VCDVIEILTIVWDFEGRFHLVACINQYIVGVIYDASTSVIFGIYAKSS
jgi:hypothetical protein